MWVSRAGFRSSTGEQSRWSQCPRHILRDSLPLCSVGGCFPTRSAEDVLCVALLCLQEGSGGEAEGESSSMEVEEGRRKAPLPICASSALAAPLPSSGAHLICGIAQLAGAARNVGRLQLPRSWCCRRKERCVWGGSVAVLPPTPCPPAPASSACSSAGLSWAALWLSRGGQSPGRGGISSMWDLCPAATWVAVLSPWALMAVCSRSVCSLQCCPARLLSVSIVGSQVFQQR